MKARGIVIVLPLLGDVERHVDATYAVHVSGALIVARTLETVVYAPGQWLRVTKIEQEGPAA